MASWQQFTAEAPDLAARLQGFLDAHTHKTIATLRRDGSPRISGIEATIRGGELMFGAMPGSRKAKDLQHDPRFALHSGSDDPPAWRGDGKVSGRVVEITDSDRRRELLAAMGGGEGGSGHVFVADVAEASVVRLGEPADHLVIELWQPGRPVRTMRRD